MRQGVQGIRVQVVELSVVVVVSGASYLEESLDQVQPSDVVVRQSGTNSPSGFFSLKAAEEQHVTWHSKMALSLHLEARQSHIGGS